MTVEANTGTILWNIYTLPDNGEAKAGEQLVRQLQDLRLLAVLLLL